MGNQLLNANAQGVASVRASQPGDDSCDRKGDAMGKVHLKQMPI